MLRFNTTTLVSFIFLATYVSNYVSQLLLVVDGFVLPSSSSSVYSCWNQKWLLSTSSSSPVQVAVTNKPQEFVSSSLPSTTRRVHQTQQHVLYMKKKKNSFDESSASTSSTGSSTRTFSLSTSSTSSSFNRRQVGELSIALTGVLVSFFGSYENTPIDYGLWGILPVGTYKQKKTIFECIVPDTIWTMDQKFGILNVQVPIRMTIIKLQKSTGGGLFVYNPIAATQECINYIKEIERSTGEYVKYIVVGSVALEHKVYAGVLAQKFTNAQVWLTPGQYSFPINLPESFLGFPLSRTFIIPITNNNNSIGTTGSSIMNNTTSTTTTTATTGGKSGNNGDDIPKQWMDEFQYATLGPIISRDGAFSETVFCHKATKTLLVTDTAIQVDDEIPSIYNTDPLPLLFHARTTVNDIVQDTIETRQRGWRRIVLFSLYFMPSAIIIKDIDVCIKERRPDINTDYFGIYPWDWVGNEQDSWDALKGNNNKPLVAPILQVLLLNRNPIEVLDFANTVGSWDFDHIIPSHFKNYITCTGQEYKTIFDFVKEQGVPKGYPVPLQNDLQLLFDSEQSLLQSGAIVPTPPKVGGTYSRADIIERTIYQCRRNVCTPKAYSEV